VIPVGNLARTLGGEVVGRDRVLAPGPGHSPRDRSLSVMLDPTTPDGFVVHSFANDDWRACRDHVAARLGITRDRTRAVVASTPPPRLIRPAAANGLALWKEATSAAGTLAEQYLKSRSLTLPERADEVLRFHPSCPFGSVRHPCMVALYRDIQTNEPKAIHRTALTADGRKIDRKALGPKGGCAIKLSADDDVMAGLTIAEGIETALAGMAINFRPAWALARRTWRSAPHGPLQPEHASGSGVHRNLATFFSSMARCHALFCRNGFRRFRTTARYSPRIGII
jgi:putative DNA primase/helicase